MDKLEPIKKNILDSDALIIDEWFANGFNKVRAVQSVIPELKYSSAACRFGLLEKRQEVKDYVEFKKSELRARTDIKAIHIIDRLLAVIHCDPTMYAALSVDELKELAPELKIPIKDIKYKTKETIDGNGRTTIETTHEVILHDQAEAIKEYNKMIGNYGVHNLQRASTGITKEQLEAIAISNPSFLETLLMLKQGQGKTIDISHEEG